MHNAAARKYVIYFSNVRAGLIWGFFRSKVCSGCSPQRSHLATTLAAKRSCASAVQEGSHVYLIYGYRVMYFCLYQCADRSHPQGIVTVRGIEVFGMKACLRPGKTSAVQVQCIPLRMLAEVTSQLACVHHSVSKIASMLTKHMQAQAEMHIQTPAGPEHAALINNGALHMSRVPLSCHAHAE